jgi:Carboxypeptidase regulatory-like domain/TonB dependent receptor-like, beta-barrel
MRRLSLAIHVALLVVSVISMSALVQAQYRTSIQGVVTDPTGAVVPGATLTLTNPATGQKQVRVSNDVGVYNFNALAAAPFKLEVEAKGFKKKVLDNLQLIPEQANAVDVVLELGSESTVVNVNAALEPAIDTQTASINGVVSDRQIQHMPSFGRDVLKLAQLAPGSFADGSQGGGGDRFYNLPGTQSGASQSGGSTGIFATENLAPLHSNGNQIENNGISIDGISTTSAVWGGSTDITPSEDSVESVKIVSNGYDAEDGRFSGSQLKITSKSGTNDFHGSLFFTTHQPNLNAYQRYNGGNSPTRDNSKFSQFGGSVGGPIWKNKIFAFFNYETVRQPNSDLPGTGWYDTPDFDALAPAGSIAATYLSFPGNGVLNHGLSSGNDCGSAGLIEGVNCVTIPGKGINLGTPLTTGLGTQDLGWTSVTDPGCGGAGTGCGTPGSPFGTVADLANYITSKPTTFTAVQYNGRLDADVTAKDRIGFAVYWVPQSTDTFNGNRAYDIFRHNQVNNAFSLIWNRTFSPTLLNEARVNAAGWRWNEVKDNPQSPVGLPVDNIGAIGSITPTNFGPAVGSILNQWTYSYKDVATKIIGRHTIKFGGEGTRLFYLQACVGCGVPSYNFFNLWDFLNDAPKNEGGGFDPNTGFPTTIRQDQRENILGFFVQDDIKVRPNLTLNLGVRWSYFSPLSSKQDNMLRAFPGAGADYLTGLVIRKGDSWNAQKNNFSPEIGFAWSPSKYNNRLVFRGGYGLNYNQEEIAISANIVNNPGLVVFPSFDTNSPDSINPGIIYAVSSDPHNLYGYPANPNTVSAFGSNGLPTTGTVNVQIFPGTLPTMRVHHYSFDMQYDLGHNFVASLGYQGSLSRDIFFHQNPLAVPATLGYTFNPQIGGGDYWAVNGRANYNAMLAELKHQFSRQFMADVQYTWAKSMDTSSAPYSEQPYPYHLSLDYGRSDYNVTNAFKIYGMWQPVFFHGSNSWMEKIVGGWSLSGIFNWHSGFPFSPFVSVQNGSLYCKTCGYGQLLPGAYLGGAGTSTSSDAFKGPVSSNYPKGAMTYFSTPTYTPYNCNPDCEGTALPQSPGVARNSLTMPGYRDLDLTLAKAFGLPKMPVLGENARFELRLDAYNVFNNMNLNPNNISNNIGNSNFGTISGALAARVLSLGARFSF